MKTYKINDVTLSETELRKLIKENPELKEEKPTRWKPEYNEKYWYVDGGGSIRFDYWTDRTLDNFKWRTGNCFKTEEEAQKALERIKAINTVTLAIEELNEGWVPDWEDGEQKIYIFYNYDHCVGKFDLARYGLAKDCLVLPYIKSEELAQQIIKDYEKELKLIFEVDLS